MPVSGHQNPSTGFSGQFWSASTLGRLLRTRRKALPLPLARKFSLIPQIRAPNLPPINSLPPCREGVPHCGAGFGLGRSPFLRHVPLPFRNQTPFRQDLYLAAGQSAPNSQRTVSRLHILGAILASFERAYNRQSEAVTQWFTGGPVFLPTGFFGNTSM